MKHKTILAGLIPATAALAGTLAVYAATKAPAALPNADLLSLRIPGDFEQVTEKRLPMAQNVAIACAAGGGLPPTNHRALVPNAGAVFQVFVTPIGLAAMHNPKPVFPVGTIILKQKFAAPDAKTPILYTGMLKREAGYNKTCGDWEFFTVNGEGTAITARGRIDSCMACHASYKESDFVTREYPIKNILPSKSP